MTNRDYKKGDRVEYKRANGSTGTGVAMFVCSAYVKILSDHSGQTLNKDHRDVRLLEEKLMFESVNPLSREDKREDRSYEFSVQVRDQINVEKILEDLSFSNPLALVEFDGRYFYVLHSSIYEKTDICKKGDKLYEKLNDIGESGTWEYNLCEIKQTDIQKLKSVVREIMDADYKKSVKAEGRGPVKVTILNM